MDAIDERFKKIQDENAANKNKGLGKVALDKDQKLTSSGIEMLKSIIGSSAVETHKFLEDKNNEVIMEGLMLIILTSKDSCMVKSSLEFLNRMADHPIGRHMLGKNEDLRDALVGLIESQEREECHQEIGSKLKAKLEVRKCHPTQPLRETKNQLDNMEAPAARGHKKKSKRRSIFCVNNSNCKIVRLYVRGIHNRDDEALARRLLIEVKGVISITVSQKQNRAEIRCKPDLQPELLALAIRKSQTMNAELITKDDDGNETIVPFNFNQADAEIDNDLEYPLNDSPLKGDNLLAKPGQEGEGRCGLLSHITNFLQNSFYW